MSQQKIEHDRNACWEIDAAAQRVLSNLLKRSTNQRPYLRLVWPDDAALRHDAYGLGARDFLKTLGHRLVELGGPGLLLKEMGVILRAFPGHVSFMEQEITAAWWAILMAAQREAAIGRIWPE